MQFISFSFLFSLIIVFAKFKLLESGNLINSHCYWSLYKDPCYPRIQITISYVRRCNFEGWMMIYIAVLLCWICDFHDMITMNKQISSRLWSLWFLISLGLNISHNYGQFWFWDDLNKDFSFSFLLARLSFVESSSNMFKSV